MGYNRLYRVGGNQMDVKRRFGVLQMDEKVLSRQGNYLLFGETKRKNAEYVKFVKRIGSMSEMKQKMMWQARMDRDRARRKTVSDKGVRLFKPNHCVGVRVARKENYLYCNSMMEKEGIYSTMALISKLKNIVDCFVWDLYIV